MSFSKAMAPLCPIDNLMTQKVVSYLKQFNKRRKILVQKAKSTRENEKVLHGN